MGAHKTVRVDRRELSLRTHEGSHVARGCLLRCTRNDGLADGDELAGGMEAA